MSVDVPDSSLDLGVASVNHVVVGRLVLFVVRYLERPHRLYRGRERRFSRAGSASMTKVFSRGSERP